MLFSYVELSQFHLNFHLILYSLKLDQDFFLLF